MSNHTPPPKPADTPETIERERDELKRERDELRRWTSVNGVLDLESERDEARSLARHWRDVAVSPLPAPPLPWEEADS